MVDGNRQHNRRSFLKVAGVAGFAGLAGCSGDGGGDGGGGGDGDGGTDGGSDGGDGTTQTMSQTEEKGTLKIGMPTWLSGPLSAQGDGSAKGAQIIVDWINEDGGANGYTFELIPKDTQATPETAVQRTRQLVQQDDVDIIAGIQASSSAKALNQFTANQGIPYVTAAQTPDITKEECREMTFRPSTSLIHQETMLAEAMHRMVPEDVTRVAGINPDYVYGHQSWEVFKREFKKRRPDVEFVSEQFPAFLKGDYAKEIQALLDAEPDVVQSVLFSGDMIAFAKQAQQFDFFDEIGDFGSGAVDSVAAALGTDMPEMIAFNPTHWSYEKNERMQRFSEEWVSRHDSMPDGWYPGYGAFIIDAIRAAVEESGGISKDDLVNGLTGLTFESLIPETTLREGDNQGFHSQNLVGRYGPVEEQIVPGEEIYGYQSITEIPASAMEEVDPDECEAF